MNDHQFAELHFVLHRIAIALEKIQDNEEGSLTGIEQVLSGVLTALHKGL